MKKCGKKSFLLGKAQTCRQYCLYKQQENGWFVHFNSCESERKIQLELFDRGRGNPNHFGYFGYCGLCHILWGMFSKDYIERNEWGKEKEGVKCNNFEV